jgi:hypothetical protein
MIKAQPNVFVFLEVEKGVVDGRQYNLRNDSAPEPLVSALQRLTSCRAWVTDVILVTMPGLSRP